MAYLVAEAGQAHRRDSLASIFWPDQPQEVALKNLRHVVYKLRQVLSEPDAGKSNSATQGKQTSYLIVTPQTVQFNPESDFWLDVAHFAGAIAASKTHHHRRLEVCGTCHARLTGAAELYKADFLAGFSLTDSAAFDEWLLLKREELHRQALQTHALLANYHEARGDYAAALSYAWRLLKLETWQEEAHRRAMRLLWLTGRRSAAITQYETCRRVIADEFGILPDAETQTLYSRILAGAPGDEENRVATSSGDNNNLPTHATPFVGREDELRQIAERLENPDRRLLTLLGPGGIGKSRLALSAAANQIRAFEDGVYFVPMAPVADSNLIISAIAQALSLPLSGKEEEEQQLLRYLTDKEMLLVMDNYEHLLMGTGILLRIIELAPRVSLLVTSRERLNLQGESVLEVSGLSYPSDEYHVLRPALDSDDLLKYEAARLFLERTRARDAEFQLTATELPAVVTICRIVGGFPLAIELASAQVGDYTCAEIARAIQSSLDFLETDQRDISPLHSSLRAVFNYSWNLLSDEEKPLFAKLSVFRGGWDKEAAEAVTGASQRRLGALVSKSLITRSTNETGMRYDIHEVLRQYVAEKLDEDIIRRAEVKKSHAQHFLNVAARAHSHLTKNQEESKWLALLEREHNNLRAALAWAVESEEVELALRLAVSSQLFWYLRSYFTEGRGILASVLRMVEANGIGGERGRATSFSDREEIEKIYGRALYGLGVLQRSQCLYEAAVASLQKSLTIYRRIGDKAFIASVLNVLGVVAHDQAEYGTARSLYGESLELAKEQGDRHSEARSLNNLGIVAREQGDYGDARSMFRQSLAISREIGDTHNTSLCLLSLGLVDWYSGEYMSAQAHLLESLALFHAAAHTLGIADCLEGLARVAASHGHIERAACLWGAAESLREQIGAPLPPADRADYDRNVDAARAEMGEQLFAAAWASGRALTPDQAVAYASQLI